MVQTLGCGPTVGSQRSSSVPPFLERVWVVPPPPPSDRGVCTSVLTPHLGGAVPYPMGMGQNGRTDLPRGSTKTSPPLSWTVFLPGCPLTGHNWAAPFLIDRTPFPRHLILALLLISDNVHPNPSPIHNNPCPRYPCSICHLDVGRDSLQCTACLMWVHFHSSSLTRADFRTICATSTSVGWRCLACCPQSQTGPPTQTNSLVTTRASPPSPPPGFSLLPPVFYQLRPHQGLPRYSCSLCSHDVGKNTLKCSTCSKWVHFSCSSLIPANFRKICAAGSTMGWNCPACLNGDHASPTHQQAFPNPVSPVPPPLTPPQIYSDVLRSFLPLPSHPPSLTLTLFLLSLYFPHHHCLQAHNQSTTRRHTLNELHAPSKS